MIRSGVHIHVAVAGVVLDDGDGGGFGDGPDKPLAAAGYDQVDQAFGAAHSRHDGPVGIVDGGYALGGQVG